MCDKTRFGYSTLFLIAVTNLFLSFKVVLLIRCSIAGLTPFSLVTGLFWLFLFAGVNRILSTNYGVLLRLWV